MRRETLQRVESCASVINNTTALRAQIQFLPYLAPCQSSSGIGYRFPFYSCNKPSEVKVGEEYQLSSSPSLSSKDFTGMRMAAATDQQLQ